MGDSREAKRVQNFLALQDEALRLNPHLTRRDVLKIAGYGSLAAFIAACGGGATNTPTGITARCEAGYADTQKMLARKPWEKPVDPMEGVIIHQDAPMSERLARS